MSEYYDIKGSAYALHSCRQCGVLWLFPKAMDVTALKERAKASGIYCPNGHSFVYTGESDADKLRRERDRLLQDKARLEDERRVAEQLQAKAERALTRHKKRAAAGTCPCCKRTFSALATHMKAKHPEFVAEARSNVVSIKTAAA